MQMKAAAESTWHGRFTISERLMGNEKLFSSKRICTVEHLVINGSSIRFIGGWQNTSIRHVHQIHLNAGRTDRSSRSTDTSFTDAFVLQYTSVSWA